MKSAAESLIMTLLLPPSSYMSDILASLALLSALLVAAWVTRRAMKGREDLPRQAARRWRANVRNALLLVAIIGLIMIWAPQLRTFALSLTAVAVAIVVATKELILCLSGAAFRTFTRAYAIGDLVEIGSIRGEVLDINLLAVRLRDMDNNGGMRGAVGQSTVVPHSLVFSHPVRIIAPAGTFAEQVFALVFETKLNLFSRIGEIRAIAVSASEEDAEVSAPTDRGKIEDLRVSLTTTELGRQKIEIAFKAHPDVLSSIQNAISAAIGSFVLSLQIEQESRAMIP